MDDIYEKGNQEEIKKLEQKFTELTGVKTFIEKNPNKFHEVTRYDIRFEQRISGCEYLTTGIDLAGCYVAYNAFHLGFCAGRINQSDKHTLEYILSLGVMVKPYEPQNADEPF